MKQVLFIIAVALYLVSLCACGDQKIQSKSKQDSATEQVVQEQMANATGETSAPPTAIPEQQPASEESVSEPEQAQPAEAFPDDEPSQSASNLDVDLTTLSSTMVYSEVYNMMYEPDRYVGKRIKMDGQFAVYEDPNTGAVYTACIIMDATACCSQGLEFVLAGKKTYPNDYPEFGSEITVTGTFQLYDENGRPIAIWSMRRWQMECKKTAYRPIGRYAGPFFEIQDFVWSSCSCSFFSSADCLARIALTLS